MKMDCCTPDRKSRAPTQMTQLWSILADPDPWHGFCLTVEKLCELQARDHGFTTAFKSTFPRAMNFAAIRTSSLTSASELVRSVRETGRLRPDVVLDDLILMIMANGGIYAGASVARIAASRRFAALMIQAFQAVLAFLATAVGVTPEARHIDMSERPAARECVDGRQTLLRQRVIVRLFGGLRIFSARRDDKLTFSSAVT
ncbi:hypothetical protein [Lentzea atacamensis]